MATLGYRPSVLAVFLRSDGKVLLGMRSDIGCWQFPQGGVDPGENAEQALYREMQEELGCSDFSILKRSSDEIRYDFPETIKAKIAKKYKGQQQQWFLCRYDEGKKT